LALASIGTAVRAGSVPESRRWIYGTFNVVAGQIPPKRQSTVKTAQTFDGGIPLDAADQLPRVS